MKRSDASGAAALPTVINRLQYLTQEGQFFNAALLVLLIRAMARDA
jgi:hypothetical protein